MNDALINRSKKYTLRYFQLKVGHGAIGAYLTKIEVIETLQYWWCSQAKKSLNTYTPNVDGRAGKDESSSKSWVQKESERRSKVKGAGVGVERRPGRRGVAWGLS